MPNFVHIDIAADDPERAGEFYEKVFGWHVQKLEGPVPYWVINTATSEEQPGIGGGIGKRDEPWQSVTPTIEVDSVDRYEEKIKAEGGTVVTPKNLIPGVGYLLAFKDTEGNIFAILEPTPDNTFATPPPG